MTKISIIVPVYNADKYLKRCLESLLNQTLKDIEILLINDGSSDNSLEIIKDYARKDSRIKFFSQSNQGQGTARNFGIKEAKGEFLSFVDADDSIELNFCEEMYKNALLNNSDIVAGHFNTIYKKAKKNKFPKKRIHKTFEEKINVIKNGSTCDKIFKTKMIKENNILFPEGIFWEDNLFIIKALYYSNIFSLTDKTHYNYFCNFDSTTHLKRNKEKLKNSLVEILNLITDFAISEKFTLKEFIYLKEYLCVGLINFEYLTDKNIYSKLPSILKYDESFILRGNKIKYDKFFHYLFSLKNSPNKRYKVLTVLGLCFRFKNAK